VYVQAKNHFKKQSSRALKQMFNQLAK